MARSTQRSIMALLFFGALALLFGPAGAARADIAPPPPPEGANITPGEETTQVRMLAETVIITAANTKFDQPPSATVSANFTMRNLGEAQEQMEARFPLNVLYPMYQGDVNECVYPLAAPEISDFRVKVNGAPVTARNTVMTVKSNFNQRPEKQVNCWANFSVVFPPGEDVSIEVSYSVLGYFSYKVDGNVAFPYVLLTGAAWQGTIGSAEIIFRAPFELTDLTLVGYYPEDAQVEGNQVRWYYEDFEPGQNVEATIINPGLWQRILQEKETLEKTPNDGEAWGRLGRWYKTAALMNRGFRWDPGGEQLFELSKAAYEKTVALKPQDADWHAGFAELLCWNGWYESFGGRHAARDDLMRCVDELRRSLSINPNQSLAREMVENLSYDGLVAVEGQRVDYLALTATITAMPELATSTPAPSATPAPSSTSAPTDTAAPTPSSTPESAPSMAAPPALATPVAAPIEASSTPAEALPTPTQAAAGRDEGGRGLCGSGAIPIAALLAGWVMKRRMAGR